MPEIKSNNGHYELFDKGNFICSCDNLSEVDEEIKLLKESEGKE